jgi:2,4-dienoyl-CoA reductase-like NADH-dependent reductase (Old Yellow Enzyme family)
VCRELECILPSTISGSDLLSQFLSIKNNHRVDDYGPPSELKLLHDIVSSIRAEPRIPASFVIGIKLNAGDYAGDQFTEEHALSHIRSITAWRQVDFLEIRLVGQIARLALCNPFELLAEETTNRLVGLTFNII